MQKYDSRYFSIIHWCLPFEFFCWRSSNRRDTKEPKKQDSCHHLFKGQSGTFWSTMHQFPTLFSQSFSKQSWLYLVHQLSSTYCDVSKGCWHSIASLQSWTPTFVSCKDVLRCWMNPIGQWVWHEFQLLFVALFPQGLWSSCESLWS